MKLSSLTDDIVYATKFNERVTTPINDCEDTEMLHTSAKEILAEAIAGKFDAMQALIIEKLITVRINEILRAKGQQGTV